MFQIFPKSPFLSFITEKTRLSLNDEFDLNIANIGSFTDPHKVTYSHTLSSLLMALRGSTRTIIRSHFVSMAARNNFFHFSSFLPYLPAPSQEFHCHSSAPVLKTCSVKISLHTSPKTTHAYLMWVLWFSLPCFNSRISVCVSLSHNGWNYNAVLDWINIWHSKLWSGGFQAKQDTFEWLLMDTYAICLLPHAKLPNITWAIDK